MFTRTGATIVVLGICFCLAIAALSQTRTLSPSKTTSKSTQAPLTKEGRVSEVQASATPAEFSGACPGAGKRINFRGSITTTGPAEVQYTWLRSDGASDTNPHALKFTAAGTKQVSDYWQVAQTFNGWEALKVTAPNQKTSAHAVFHLKCTDPNALAAKKTGAHKVTPK